MVPLSCRSNLAGRYLKNTGPAMCRCQVKGWDGGDAEAGVFNAGGPGPLHEAWQDRGGGTEGSGTEAPGMWKLYWMLRKHSQTEERRNKKAMRLGIRGDATKLFDALGSKGHSVCNVMQMKGRWESEINVKVLLIYFQKRNCYLQNRIIMFCFPVPTLIYLW
jgi:hypothetical protein